MSMLPEVFTINCILAELYQDSQQQALGNHPAAGETLLHAHQGAEFLFLFRAKHESPVHHA